MSDMNDKNFDPATALLKASKALVDAVTFDDSGALVAGQWVGGNGGLISRETIIAADQLRKTIDFFEGAIRE